VTLASKAELGWGNRRCHFYVKFRWFRG